MPALEKLGFTMICSVSFRARSSLGIYLNSHSVSSVFGATTLPLVECVRDGDHLRPCLSVPAYVDQCCPQVPELHLPTPHPSMRGEHILVVRREPCQCYLAR